MAQYRSPDPLNFDEPNWDCWKRQFMTFRLVTKLHAEEEEVQVASLKYCMGREAEDIMPTFSLSSIDSKKFEIVLKKFDEYFKPKINVIRLRRIFQRRMQIATENEEAYLRALYSAAADCDFGVLKKERIRDQFISGIRDDKLAEKLEHSYMSNRNNFTLDFVVEYVRTYCDVTEGRKLEKAMKDNVQLDLSEVHRYKTQQMKSVTSCKFCGNTHQFGKCPAYGKRCSICHKINHFAKVCRSDRNAARVQEVQRAERQEMNEYYNPMPSQEEDHFFLGECNLTNSNNPLIVRIKLGNDNTVAFKVDTGADVSILNYETYCNLKPKPKIYKSDIVLSTPSGKMKYLGFIRESETYKLYNYCERLFVTMPGCPTNNLLSREASMKLGIIKFVGEVLINNSLFGFGCWKTEPVQFRLENSVVPYAITNTRKIPFNLWEPVKNTLANMIKEDIIETVEHPTDWLSPMLPVPKKDGRSVRICVDFRKLNLGLKREAYHIPTFEELSFKLAGATIMSKLDAASGFFQIPLHENSRDFTAFLTPFGRYRFKRLPMGVNLAPEIYQRKMCDLLKDIQGVIIYMDDVIVFGKSQESHDNILKLVLDRIDHSGLKLNRDKCIFSRNKLEFLGHIISDTGIHINPNKVEAIQNLKIPQNVAELRRVLGMVNFVTRFVPGAQIDLKPLNDLLKKNIAWVWGPAQIKSFENIKLAISSAPVLAYYDPSKPIVVSADSSSYAMGGVLFQVYDNCFKPVAYCSRTLTNAEIGYAQIERELLAAVWVCERFNSYLLGSKFRLQTDHKPLIPLINTKILSDAPVRCQRLLMRLARYTPIAEFVPGKRLVVADSLSRDVNNHTFDNNELNIEVLNYEIQSMNALPVSKSKLRLIIDEQLRDADIKLVKEMIITRWTDEASKKLPEYFAKRGELSVINELVILGKRIVIPASLRKEMLYKIHNEGHLSLQKCRTRIKENIWWPKISRDIGNYIENCQFCQKYKRRNKCEPLRPTELPNRPWKQLGLDLFELHGKMYLIVVDYFSRWFETIKLNRIDSESVILSLKNIFCIFGIPDLVKSDRGLQFNSCSFRKFALDYDFVHILSDPFYPQGNACAERAVQVAKRLLRQDDPWAALMAYRSTPLDTTGFSPSQLLMGRSIRTKLPTLPFNLIPQWPDFDVVKKNDAQMKLASARGFNERKGAKKLPPITEGQYARIRLPLDKTWSEPNQILERRNESSYAVRNRRYLQLLPEPEISNENKENNHDGGGEVAGGSPECLPGGSPGCSPTVPSDRSQISLPNSTDKFPVSRYGRVIKPVIKYQA